MAIPKWCDDNVGVLRPERIIDRGKTILVYPDTPTHYVIGSIQPLSGELETEFRVNNKITYLGYFDYGANIEDVDRLSFDNKVFLIQGGCKKIKSPTGRLNHIEVNLKTYEG